MVTRQFGSVDGLWFELSWPGPAKGGSLTRRTTGWLTAGIGDTVVWAWESDEKTSAFEWTWVDLVEFLSNAWPWLEWEEGWPFGLQPGNPTEIESIALERWEGMAASRVLEEEDELRDFLEVHDLSRAIQGAHMPRLLIVREGRTCWVATKSAWDICRLSDVLETLTDLGDEIVGRIDDADVPGAETVCTHWELRREISLEEKIEIATGFDADELDELRDDGELEELWSVDPERFEPNEVMAAARMASGLRKQIVRQILAVIQRIPSVETRELDVLSERAADFISRYADRRAYEQAYELAQWLRGEWEALTSECRVEPEQILEDWKVDVRDEGFKVSHVDAVACWGPSHGPGIVVNRNGQHAQSTHGRRSTLAHEMCHLLVDRDGALPLTEVLGGRVSLPVEKRARAFAAELLMPREIAGERLGQSDVDTEEVVRELSETYGVSREIVAWQARNSPMQLPREVMAILRAYVSRPDRF